VGSVFRIPLIVWNGSVYLKYTEFAKRLQGIEYSPVINDRTAFHRQYLKTLAHRGYLFASCLSKFAADKPNFHWLIKSRKCRFKFGL